MVGWLRFLGWLMITHQLLVLRLNWRTVTIEILRLNLRLFTFLFDGCWSYQLMTIVFGLVRCQYWPLKIHTESLHWDHDTTLLSEMISQAPPTPFQRKKAIPPLGSRISGCSSWDCPENLSEATCTYPSKNISRNNRFGGWLCTYCCWWFTFWYFVDDSGIATGGGPEMMVPPNHAQRRSF